MITSATIKQNNGEGVWVRIQNVSVYRLPDSLIGTFYQQFESYVCVEWSTSVRTQIGEFTPNEAFFSIRLEPRQTCSGHLGR